MVTRSNMGFNYKFAFYQIELQPCGKKEERKACCETQGSKVIKEDVEELNVVKEEGIEAQHELAKKLGSFTEFHHKVAGTVFELFQSRFLLIKDFNYDGKGIAPIFLAGTTGIPSGDGEVDKHWNILPSFPGGSPISCP